MLKIEIIDREHAVGTGNSSMLCLWRGETTLDAVIELHTISAALGKRTPNKVGHLTVVEQGAAMPDGTVRDELAKVLRGVSSSVACSALVFEVAAFERPLFAPSQRPSTRSHVSHFRTACSPQWLRPASGWAAFPSS